MEHKHESDNYGAMRSRANIALTIIYAHTEFGDAYTRYAANTPAFFPTFGVKAHA